MNQLPPGWIEATLGDVADVQSGVGFPEKFQGNTSGKYPVYKVGDVSRAYLNHNGFLSKANYYVSEEVSTEMKGKIFTQGTTVFAKIGEALKLNRRAFVVAEGLVDNNVMGVKSHLKDSELFIYRFLQYFDIASLSRSTTVPSVRKSDIEDILVPLAPLPEQIRIANKLDSILAKVDNAQARLEKIPTLLKRFRQALLAAATSGELTREWREENHKFIDDWIELILGDVAVVQTGSTPLKSESSYYEGGNIPWLTSTVTNQRMVSSSEYFVTPKAVKECRLKIFLPGTLLMAMYGEGKTRGQVTEITIDATINQACAAIMVNESKIRKDFLKLSIENNYEKTRMMAEGGTQPNLNLSKVKSIPVKLPSKEEQTEIVRRVESLFALADSVEKQYQAAKARLDRLTQSILAKAFRGELVPQDPNDEPAAELLKRIQAQRYQPAQTGAG